MSQPVALFGLKVKPGDAHRMSVIRDFKVTSVSFAADALKGNARAVVRVHITPSPGHPITEEEELADASEDSDEDEEKEYEERSFVLCTLTPGKIEQASVDVTFSEQEEIGFSVTGDNEIDLLGNYVLPADDFDQPPYDSDDDSEIYSDEYDEEDDDDEYDSEEMAADGLEGILAEGDSDEEEADSDRFQELGDIPSVAAQEKKSAAAAAAAGKKRKAVAEPEADADVDVSMASTTAPVTDAELAVVAAAEGLDVSKLTKAQRKRLNKKLRTSSGEADAADASVVSAASEKPAAKAKESVKATVVQDGKAKTAAKETTTKDGKQVSVFSGVASTTPSARYDESTFITDLNGSLNSACRSTKNCLLVLILFLCHRCLACLVVSHRQGMEAGGSVAWDGWRFSVSFATHC